MKKALIPLLVSGLVATSWPMLSTAQSDAPQNAATPTARHSEHRARMMGHHGEGKMHHASMRHEQGASQGGAMGWLKGLDLSEAQRDRMFEIMHAQAPKMREQRKALQAARKELGQFSTAAQLDATQVQAASTKVAQAMASMIEHQVRTRNALFQQLTPEQQKTVQARMTAMQEHGRGGQHGMGQKGHRHGAGHGPGPGHRQGSDKAQSPANPNS
jgi:Spy/CpxP family protein refolding chaperone